MEKTSGSRGPPYEEKNDSLLSKVGQARRLRVRRWERVERLVWGQG